MRTKTSTWYETKVRYQKMMDDGSEKEVSERYVVDALSFTEAESAIIEEMSVYVSGEMKVSNLGKASYSEVFFSDNDDDDKFFKAQLQFITIDEKTEREKRSNVRYLVQAKSIARALRYVDEVMNESMIDYDVIGLNVTPIMDVFEHRTLPDKKEEKDENKAE